MLENPDKINQFLNKHGLKDADQLEYTLPVLVQSGKGLSLGQNINLTKLGAESDQNRLVASVIYINICGKFSDMNAMASRVLLINPTPTQKHVYTTAYDAMQHLISRIKVGSTLASVHESTKSFIAEKDASLVERLHANFGFGIGCNYKEDLLVISAANQLKIEPGMVFHVRIVINNTTDSKDPEKQALAAIGDTVFVSTEQTDGSYLVNNLTSTISSKFS